MCMKIDYPTYKKAEKVAKSIKQRQGVECRAYSCHECRSYHIFTDGFARTKATKRKRTW